MSEHERKPDSEQPQGLTAGEDGHDEPVVVDNGPATVLFGKRHEVTASNGDKMWTRKHANNFFALYVQEEAANGEVTHVDSWSLAQITLLRVTLQSGEAFEYKLVMNSGRQDVQMTSATTGLDRDGTTGRLKFKGGRSVIVTQVQGFNGSTALISYTPVSTPKHIKVVILLTPDKP